MIYTLFFLLAFAQASRPNLLFIVVDDLSSRIGDTYAKTPNLDTMMDESFVFSRQYVASPECGPSRSSMLSSRKVENHRVEHFQQFRKLNPNVVTLPGLLRSQGYYTTAVGKVFDLWTFGGSTNSSNIKADECKRSSNRQCSFDRVYSFSEIQAGYGCNAPVLNDPKILYPKTSSGELIDDCIVNNALWQLTQQNTLTNPPPFSMFVGIMKPHMPFNCNASFYNMYKSTNFATLYDKYDSATYYKNISHPYFKYNNREPTKYKGFSSKKPVDFARGYYACISQTDYLVGKLLNKLDGLSRIAKNTIVILWGDHGFRVGEKNQFGKKNLFELDNKSPLIIRMPNKTHKTINTPVSSIDIYPTVAELLNISVRNMKLDGTSFANMMRQGDLRMISHPTPISTFEIYGPSKYIGVSQWFPNNTTMMIVGRSSPNRLKPNYASVFFKKTYKADMHEQVVIE